MRKYSKYKDTVDWIKELPSDWSAIKFKYIANIETGSTPPKADNSNYEGGDVLFIKPDELNGFIPIVDSKEKITKKALENSRLIKEFSLLTCAIGTIGKFGIAGTDCITNQQINSFTFNPKKVNPKFGIYSFIASEDEQWKNSTTNVVAIINKTSQSRISIPYPTLSEQNTIVHFLDYKTAQIDSFIANRQKQIELLKEQRSSIIDKAILHGLNRTDEVNKFDNIFVKQLPVNWKLSSVRREIMAQNFEQQDGNHGELHPVASDYVDEGIPFVLASDVNNFEVDLIRCKKIPKRIAEKLRIGFSKTGDILLTHKGTVGRVGICDTKEYPYIILTPQVTYYRIKRDYLPKYIFWQFQSNVFIEQLKLLSGGGSTRDYIGLVAQRDLKIIKPPIPEQIEIVEHIDNETQRLDNLISKYQKQIDLMQEYRTSLISQAVTGKIDVRDWKPKVKEYSIEQPSTMMVAEKSTQLE